MTVIRTFGTPPATDREILLADGATRWRVPEETPVAFIYNGRNYAVMLATPDGLVDFAFGFSLTERIVDDASEIEALDIHQEESGVELRMKVREPLLERLDLRQRRRNLVGRAGCGLCGVENADAFFEPLPMVASLPVRIDEGALMRAASTLSDWQTLNARTHTVHAAAWADMGGAIAFAREDVGRHNALDKLLGARSQAAPGNGFVVMSSRCSYEIVEKAARCGVKAVLSISAPTAFAIRKAKEARLALYAKAGDRIVAIF